MSLNMKNTLTTFDSFSFYSLVKRSAVHHHQICWPRRSTILYFKQVLTHPLLNNRVPCRVWFNEMIQRSSSFPYILLPILPLVKVGDEMKSMLFIHFPPTYSGQYLAYCAEKWSGTWMVLTVTAWAGLWAWRQATLRLHSEIIAFMLWCMSTLSMGPQFPGPESGVSMKHECISERLLNWC